MRKLQFDLASILVLALIVAGGIWMWGGRIGIETTEEQGYWLSVIAVCALVLALVASLDRIGRWWYAVHTLTKWLRQRRPDMRGTTQAMVSVVEDQPRKSPTALASLRAELRAMHGRRWRWRQPWFLLTGDAAAISALVPELPERGWIRSIRRFSKAPGASIPT